MTYYVAGGRRIILLTVFRKTTARESQEIDRAERAMRRCIASVIRPRRRVMSTRKTWTELREQRRGRSAVHAGYEEARRGYDIGRQVRALREAHDLSQRDLAERMGTTQSAIARLEAGGSRPTLSTLERVADALGTTIEVRFRDPVIS